MTPDAPEAPPLCSGRPTKRVTLKTVRWHLRLHGLPLAAEIIFNLGSDTRNAPARKPTG